LNRSGRYVDVGVDLVVPDVDEWAEAVVLESGDEFDKELRCCVYVSGVEVRDAVVDGEEKVKVSEGIFEVGAYFDLLLVPLCLVSGDDDSCYSYQAGFMASDNGVYLVSSGDEWVPIYVGEGMTAVVS